VRVGNVGPGALRFSLRVRARSKRGGPELLAREAGLRIPGTLIQAEAEQETARIANS